MKTKKEKRPDISILAPVLVQIDFEKIRKKLYADSGYILGNSRDNAYRDGVDATIEMIRGEV